jgi:hypothetical protein
MRLLACFLMLAVAALSAPAAAEVYKWVDEKGRVHYGDRPPTVQAPEVLEDVQTYDAGTPAPADGAVPAQPAAPNVAALASCIASSGAQFYGASWCPQCKKQLRQFGAAASSLPYVECSADGSRKSVPGCDAAGIKAFPTWVFPSGVRRAGVFSPESLAKLTGCV